MRRGIIALLLLVLMAAGTAYALDLKSMREVQVIPSGSTIIQFEYSNWRETPEAFIIWSKDGLAFKVFPYRGGTSDTNPIYVPADRTVTLPRPAFVDSSGTIIIKFGVADHSDTVYFWPGDQ